jgi:hypothetical protein
MDAGMPMHRNIYDTSKTARPPPQDESIWRYRIVVSEPGREYVYSNFACGLLDRVISSVSGKEYRQFMREEVFAPPDMSRTSVHVTPELAPRVVQNYGAGEKPLASLAYDHDGASAVHASVHYFRFFSIPLVCGREFSPGFTSDKDAVVINEETANVLGFENAEKALLQNVVPGGFGGFVVQVVGVVKNHHHLSLREKIEPVIYLPLPASYSTGGFLLSVRVDGRSVGPARAAVSAKWREVFPGQPLEYDFLDNEYNSQYDADRRFGRVFGLSSLLAILISCLGLFGLASFSAERRTREIGIRKVFGAANAGIAAMLAREFIQWIVLANIIAWPLTWIIMGRWLRGFAYRTTVGLRPWPVPRS